MQIIKQVINFSCPICDNIKTLLNYIQNVYFLKQLLFSFQLGNLDVLYAIRIVKQLIMVLLIVKLCLISLKALIIIMMTNFNRSIHQAFVNKCLISFVTLQHSVSTAPFTSYINATSATVLPLTIYIYIKKLRWLKPGNFDNLAIIFSIIVINCLYKIILSNLYQNNSGFIF